MLLNDLYDANVDICLDYRGFESTCRYYIQLKDYKGFRVEIGRAARFKSMLYCRGHPGTEC